MTLYEEILQMYQLVSYQDNRRKNGHVVLREEDGSFAVTNEPSGPPSPEWVFAASGPMANMRPVADAILILGK